MAQLGEAVQPDHRGRRKQRLVDENAQLAPQDVALMRRRRPGRDTMNSTSWSMGPRL
jgi:hypothetical protein